MSKNTKENDKELLEDAVTNVERWYDYYSENISKFRKANKFVYEEDGQWETQDIEAYKKRRKVRLTVNQTHAYVKQLTGQFRQNTPDFQVRPIGQEEIVDQKEIDIIDQMLRTHIDGKKARIAFQIAYENALSGYGAVEVSTEYENDNSFKQTVKITPLKNPIKAGFDPAAETCNKTDGDYSFLYKRMSKKQFKRKYPNIEYTDFSIMQESTAGVFDWGDKEEVSVLRYAYKKYYKKVIVELSNNKVVDEDDFKKVINKINKAGKEQAIFSGMPYEPVKEEQRRTVDSYRIYVCTMVKDKILEAPKLWKPSILPFLYVDGESYVDLNNDKQVIRPFVQDAKGPQKAANYAFTENANALKRSQYHKKMLTPQQIEGHEKYYKGSNSTDAVLYNMKPGTPPPIDSPPTSPSPAYMQSFESASQAMRFVVGMHESTIGAQGLERSGVALGHEIRQGNDGNFDAIDNIYRLMESVGNLILELFPTLYDSTRTVLLTGQDGNVKPLTLNKPAGFNKEGEQQYENDMRNIKYSVEIEPGASFALQKKEALDALLKFVAVNPQLASVAPDLIAENIDIKNGPQLVKRARTLLPPAIVAEESGKPPPPPQPNPQVILEQQKVNNEQTKLQLDARKMQQDAQVNQMKSGTELQKAQMDLHAKQLDTITDKNARVNERLAQENSELKKLVNRFVGGTNQPMGGI